MWTLPTESYLEDIRFFYLIHRQSPRDNSDNSLKHIEPRSAESTPWSAESTPCSVRDFMVGKPPQNPLLRRIGRANRTFSLGYTRHVDISLAAWLALVGRVHTANQATRRRRTCNQLYLEGAFMPAGTSGSAS